MSNGAEPVTRIGVEELTTSLVVCGGAKPGGAQRSVAPEGLALLRVDGGSGLHADRQGAATCDS